ncbi:OLC1v1019447C1 [Oldenlandia corymbosa var. corymbosa]|uniref:OLC1v1019447C1 n=1 Tax=Oldenlandia corymbosa var. corymbosa TaxID=529605 RepID=A0AAV1EE67_OLDCO|nr:OLC1v1019447C1 [Oldenlandia corymbosa var. corymbosa]
MLQMEMLSYSAPDLTSRRAKVMGIAFVKQYYQLLHQQPELVHKFYRDSSFLRHADSDGTVTTITTLRAINNKIVSFGYGNYKIEVKTAHVEDSYQASIFIKVTGCLTGTDNVPRNFTQSFFLAPQENGYFIENSCFDGIEESKPSKTSSALAHAAAGVVSVTAPLTLDPESGLAADHSARDSVTASETEETQSDPEVKSASRTPPMRGFDPVWCFHSSATVAAVNANEEAGTSKKAPVVARGPESIYAHKEGNSIYIYNLAPGVTYDQVEKDLERFGRIKWVGKSQGNQPCPRLGFVQFESFESAENAIKASPINIGGRLAVAEDFIGSGGSLFESESVKDVIDAFKKQIHLK